MEELGTCRDSIIDNFGHNGTSVKITNLKIKSIGNVKEKNNNMDIVSLIQNPSSLFRSEKNCNPVYCMSIEFTLEEINEYKRL